MNTLPRAVKSRPFRLVLAFILAFLIFFGVAILVYFIAGYEITRDFLWEQSIHAASTAVVMLLSLAALGMLRLRPGGRERE